MVSSLSYRGKEQDVEEIELFHAAENNAFELVNEVFVLRTSLRSHRTLLLSPSLCRPALGAHQAFDQILGLPN